MNLYGYAIAGALIAGAGASGWHWAPFIGPQAQFEAKDKRIADLSGKLKASQEAVQARDKAIRERDARLAENGSTAALEAQEMAAMMKRTCKGAFDAGYASRRCGPGPADPGVRDLRQAQAAGAFRSSRGVPAEPEGPRR